MILTFITFGMIITVINICINIIIIIIAMLSWLLLLVVSLLPLQLALWYYRCKNDNHDTHQWSLLFCTNPFRLPDPTRFLCPLVTRSVCYCQSVLSVFTSCLSVSLFSFSLWIYTLLFPCMSVSFSVSPSKGVLLSLFDVKLAETTLLRGPDSKLKFKAYNSSV